jgi:hypothetical protein
MLMNIERKVPEDDPQLAPKFLLDLTKRPGQSTAGWTLKIPIFFERDRRISRTAHVHRLFLGSGLLLRDGNWRLCLGLVEHRTGADCDQSDDANDNEWSVTLHLNRG